MEQEMYNIFGESAKFAAIYELKLRLLADKSPCTKQVSMNYSLENVENVIFKYFGKELTDQNRLLLTSCRQLRNKLFHTEFSAANKIMEDVYGISSPDLVKYIKLEEGADILEEILAHNNGIKEPSSILANKEKDTGIYGWFLQIYHSQILVRSIQTFIDAGNLIDKLGELNKTD